MKDQIQKLWRLYTGATWEKKTLWTAAGIASIPIFLSLVIHSEPAPPATSKASAQMDTYIPKGFVLVPIDVQNYAALDSILGNFGLVDLFHPANPEHPSPRLVARNVRLLRAPQNPSHFAILIQDGKVENVLKWGSQFTVILKRPDPSGTEIVKEAQNHKRTIVYDRGN